MGIARNDPSKTVDVLSDLTSLYTFGFVFFSSFSIVIGWFILSFFSTSVVQKASSVQMETSSTVS